MRKLISAGLFLSVLAGCAVAPESGTPASAPAEAPAARGAGPIDPALQGTWIPMLAELGGQEFKFGQDFVLTVAGDKYALVGGPQADRGRLEFVSGDPKGFDVIGEEGPNKGKRFPGIYRFIDGGRLEACYDLDSVGRPAAFTTLSGTKLFRIIYRRR